ncbi:MAG: type II secretion system protein [Ruminobacter sp.]|nr:type II secretion system protein [Ruminobacter sp.]
MRSNKGFTLIELVVVIVILGILAAVAAPKFMDLQSDARISALQGLQGAVKSAVNLTYAKGVVQGTEKIKDFGGSNASSGCSDGVASDKICTVYGNPAARAEGIIHALQNDSSFTKLDAVGPCDGSHEWCYFVDSTTTTIYFAPASTVGVGTSKGDSDSCALSYKVNGDDNNKTSVVETKLLKGGC